MHISKLKLKQHKTKVMLLLLTLNLTSLYIVTQDAVFCCADASKKVCEEPWR